jgi:hypothetical protein
VGLAAIVMADETATLTMARFRVAEIRDLILRPIDRRLLVEKAAIAIPGARLKSESAAIEFRPCVAPARAVKDVRIEEFSEYGALIRHRDPLRDDVFMALFGEALTGGSTEPVWARCCYCVKSEAAEEYMCFFRFFGISDETLRRIRFWIREDYVHKKEGAE